MAGLSVNPKVEESHPLDEEGKKVYDYLKAHWKIHPDFGKVNIHEQTFNMHVIGYRKEKPRREVTLEKFNEAIELRKKFNTNEILEEKWPFEFTEEQVLEIWPMFLYGRGPEGRVIMWDACGNMDPDKAKEHFLKEPGQKEMLKKFYIKFMERLNRTKQNLATEKGHLMYKHLAVFDVKELSLWKVKQVKDILGSLIKNSQKMYPESLKKMYLINTGWFFRACWKVISFFVDKQTQEKINLLGSDWIKTMEADGVALDQIPEAWGGKGTTPIKLGRDSLGMDEKVKETAE